MSILALARSFPPCIITGSCRANPERPQWNAPSGRPLFCSTLLQLLIPCEPAKIPPSQSRQNRHTSPPSAIRGMACLGWGCIWRQRAPGRDTPRPYERFLPGPTHLHILTSLAFLPSLRPPRGTALILTAGIRFDRFGSDITTNHVGQDQYLSVADVRTPALQPVGMQPCDHSLQSCGLFVTGGHLTLTATDAFWRANKRGSISTMLSGWKTMTAAVYLGRIPLVPGWVVFYSSSMVVVSHPPWRFPLAGPRR